MRIYVKVFPRAPMNEIEKISDSEFKIRVTAAPERGKANEAVVDLLVKYFDVSKSAVNIVGGKSVRTKIVDIDV